MKGQKVTAYYNEHDPFAAEWLRHLISKNLIAKGEVDERSILEVQPEDLRGFTQCHFFAGIGGWSYALRLAGIPDNARVWTGSSPCQPFSATGLQKGKNDERHLAPHFASLVAACEPPVLFGEQVASPAVFGRVAGKTGSNAQSEAEWAWIDDLFARLEDAHYACAASDIPAAGVGAPHLRQRCFFGALRLADSKSVRTIERRAGVFKATHTGGSRKPDPRRGVRPRALHGGWSRADWLAGRDGKWRPVEPGTQPLAHGLPARMGRLRGYGNAIVPQAAAAFVEALLTHDPN